MQAKVLTEGVVLTSTDVGEDDRILTFITPDRGLLRAAASAARNLKKGRTAPLDLFVHTRLRINTPARETSLRRVGEARLLAPFLGIRADYDRLCAASYIGQTVAHCVQEDDPSSGVWDLVLTCFRRLDRGDSTSGVMLLFEIRLLREAGVLPELNRCVLCGKEAAGDVHIDADRGGVLHSVCSVDRGDTPLNAGNLAVLRFLASRDLSTTEKLSLSDADARHIFKALHPFAVHHLGYESKALGMMKG